MAARKNSSSTPTPGEAAARRAKQRAANLKEQRDRANAESAQFRATNAQARAELSQHETAQAKLRAAEQAGGQVSGPSRKFSRNLNPFSGTKTTTTIYRNKRTGLETPVTTARPRTPPAVKALGSGAKAVVGPKGTTSSGSLSALLILAGVVLLRVGWGLATAGTQFAAKAKTAAQEKSNLDPKTGGLDAPPSDDAGSGAGGGF